MFILAAFTLFHLAGVATGLGGVVLAFLLILKQAVLAPIAPAVVARLDLLSRWITSGLALLWISGIVLVGFRYSVDHASIADGMLWVKVAVAGLLTLGGTMVRRVVLPALHSRLGQRLFDLGTLKSLALVGLSGAFLTVSWVTPFILGSMSIFGATSPAFDVLQYYAWGILAAWYGIMIVSLLTMQDRQAAEVRDSDISLNQQNVLLLRRLERMHGRPGKGQLAA